MFRIRVLILSVIVSFLCFSGRAMAQGRDEPGRVTFQWPSREYPTIQSALDALPDGGVLEIAEGEYYIEEPIFVIGKRVLIKGAGSGLATKKHKECKQTNGEKQAAKKLKSLLKLARKARKAGKKKGVTHLFGPAPQPVVDERGHLILPAESVEGLFNFIAADVVLRDMKLSGFDAGVVIKASERGEHAPVLVSNVNIFDTGRGILALLSDEVSITNAMIQDTLWNGISVVGQETPVSLGGPPSGTMDMDLLLGGAFIIHSAKVGIYIKNAVVQLNDVHVGGHEEGGIIAVGSRGNILNSWILANHFAGIALFESGYFYLYDNHVGFTYARVSDGWFGDAITMFLSKPVYVFDDRVYQTDRATLSNFGSSVTIADSLFACGSFAFEGEEYMGEDFVFADGGNVHCGCPVADSECVAVSAGLPPPEPVESLP